MAENTGRAGPEELSWSSQWDFLNFKAIISPIFLVVSILLGGAFIFFSFT